MSSELVKKQEVFSKSISKSPCVSRQTNSLAEQTFVEHRTINPLNGIQNLYSHPSAASKSSYIAAGDGSKVLNLDLAKFIGDVMECRIIYDINKHRHDLL